ncbi:MAG: SpoIIE family protein phosphatase [Burkholderiales bacterium]|nr:SpoIIE family protein phosphatase [Burkholderiales bacterium]
MTAAAPAGLALGRIRLLGAGLLVLLLTVFGLDLSWQRALRQAWLDAYQKVAPRTVETLPATIVAIDEKSISELGQWPWPRTVLARLIEAIMRHDPAAIGVDLLLSEPDRLSPAALFERLGLDDPVLRTRLALLPANDAVLRDAIARAPVVLGIAGTPEASAATLRAAPVRVLGGAAPGTLRRFAGVLTSLDALDAAAVGHGLLSADPVGAVVRRLPLVADVGGTLAPGLALEMLRVAAAAPSLALLADAGGVRGAGIEGFMVAAEADGAVSVHFSPRDERRYLRVVDVLSGNFDPDKLRRKLVLIGITGLGLIDLQTVATGERMPGVEVHAQLLENIFEGRMLARPRWAFAAEAGALLACGALLVWCVPWLRERHAILLAAALIIGVMALGAVAYRFGLLLLDGATPALALLLLFGALLALTLAESTRRQRVLEAEVQLRREEAARVAGELAAAQRIQTGILPRADSLAHERRIEIAARMTPAREVGGDLYDFFILPGERLFFLIGDVSGKGLPASIFMAVSKALWKSGALRAGADAGDLVETIGALMTEANREVSRENADNMFVTLVAGILDLASGELAYCNAGHDNPAVIGADGGVAARLTAGDGPPLCVVDDFEYCGARHRLELGEALVMVTDGVTEALNHASELYGVGRLTAVLEARCPGGRDAAELLDAVVADVGRFASGAEPADDLTLLVLRRRPA